MNQPLTDEELTTTPQYKLLCRDFGISPDDAPDVQLANEDRGAFWESFDLLPRNRTPL